MKIEIKDSKRYNILAGRKRLKIVSCREADQRQHQRQQQELTRYTEGDHGRQVEQRDRDIYGYDAAAAAEAPIVDGAMDGH
ncbi:hypothetical protein E2C01_039592 [Portunus trituberculatus]|uniref:Uncharacterized protein n=1 Tax=Portunus trituberculatus TaxID=210409 RepID=A0A5B7FK68_PORTR|nr:hypothetical protein [Portunus trituberculatus]